MRLDRIHPMSIEEKLHSLLAQARKEQGRTHWTAIQTSTTDGVQVGLKLDPAESRLVVYLRRPGGKEDPREMAAILRTLGLDLKAGAVFYAYGKTPAPHGWGPRKYLVALVPLKVLETTTVLPLGAATGS